MMVDLKHSQREFSSTKNAYSYESNSICGIAGTASAEEHEQAASSPSPSASFLFLFFVFRMSTTTTSRGRGQNKHYWTDEEDEKLVESLLELHHDKKWKADNGFKNGYLKHLQSMIESKLPGHGILANPHIESRIKTLKAKYAALYEMLNQSGFSWNEQEMMLVCEQSVFNEWVEKRNKDAAGLYGKPFRHYYNLGEIYGRDRANGLNVGNADDDEEEIRRENTNVDPLNLDDENVFDNVNSSVNMEPQQEGFEDVDISFTQPSPQTPSVSQQMPAQSVASNNSRRKGKALDEMSKNFGLMAKAVAGMAPKLDGLVNVLSTDKDLTELQSKLDGELSKMDFLTPVQVFHVTNILAQKHDLLRVFFTMSDERKASYVHNLLQYGLP